MVDSVVNGLTMDIAENKCEVHKKASVNKDDLNLLENSLRKIRNKEGNLREKVGDLKMEMMAEADKIDERSEEMVHLKSFSIHDAKTKEAEAFLKDLQFERSIERQKYLEHLEEGKRKHR